MEFTIAFKKGTCSRAQEILVKEWMCTLTTQFLSPLQNLAVYILFTKSCRSF
jgi:hypothetical protein